MSSMKPKTTKSSRYCCSSSSSSVFIWYFPLSRNRRTNPIPSAIVRTPSLHFARFKESSFFKPISVSSFTCFFQVFFGRPYFLLRLTSKSRGTLKTLSSSFLCTCPYHLTPFAVANPSTVLFNPSMFTCFLAVILTTISYRMWLSP